MRKRWRGPKGKNLAFLFLKEDTGRIHQATL